ncbi:substrate-binding domain-containing protein [Lacisediminihabitans profunda]|uniref:Substrate-binding domain-containing protein n=1 Tax=Lacisediminihabitans profunda TaxID=2594790 RepID=A0A5C8UPD0_9MICO|nr:substrate-binding domain-containing protein [Lacisediminihabitans profunda]TXN29377.1 substrate-binding domain-containing protein [Lacisediminihabitans profunda]
MNRIPSARGTRAAFAVLAIAGLALTGCSSTNSTGVKSSGSATADIAVGSVGDISKFSNIADICNSKGKPVSVGFVDGYGTNTWSKTVKAEAQSEAAKCKQIKSFEYAAGRGDLAATTSAITSMAAKGTNIILVIPDAGPGEAHLPAMKTATDAGSLVVAVASDPGAKAGSGFLDYTDQSPQFSGSSWAQWVVDRLGKGGGNVVFLGGPAGAAVSTGEFEGVQSVISKNPQIKLLTPQPVATNWDPAQAQTAMAGLLAQFPKIDAVVTDYGATAAGAIRAYQAAGISLPIMTSTDDNSLSCGYAALKAANPGYELATHSSRTWIGRVALRKALAAFNGKSDTEPSIYNLAIYEDSTGSAKGSILPQDACLKDAPADATPSTLLTTAEIKKLFS